MAKKLPAPTKYTEAERQEILKFSDAHGIPATRDKYGVNGGTLGIWRWKRKRGERTRKAKAAPKVMRAARKAPLEIEYINPHSPEYRAGFREGFKFATELLKEGDA